jgi:hypothetical protein
MDELQKCYEATANALAYHTEQVDMHKNALSLAQKELNELREVMTQTGIRADLAKLDSRAVSRDYAYVRIQGGDEDTADGFYFKYKVLFHYRYKGALVECEIRDGTLETSMTVRMKGVRGDPAAALPAHLMFTLLKGHAETYRQWNMTVYPRGTDWFYDKS